MRLLAANSHPSPKLRNSETPKLRLPSRLGDVDRAGRKALRKWAEDHEKVFDEASFHHRWKAQDKRGGAEHHVYCDPETGRWYKRLYHGVNSTTLGRGSILT
ncbi:MAG: hypothetical protein WCL19_03680 [Verrucomicrobiota bacterium]